jgi:hypothetical protein
VTGGDRTGEKVSGGGNGTRGERDILLFESFNVRNSGTVERRGKRCQDPFLRENRGRGDADSFRGKTVNADSFPAPEESVRVAFFLSRAGKRDIEARKRNVAS